MEELKLSKT